MRYKGTIHEMPEKKRNSKSLFGYFPIFTERHTFIINGQERIPITQLLPRPGLHLTWEGEEDSTVESHLNASIRPWRGPFFEMGLPKNNIDGSGSIYVRIGKHPSDFVRFLKETGLYKTVASMVQTAGGALPGEMDDIASLPTLSPYWTSRFYNQLFRGKDGYDLSLPGRRSLNVRLADFYKKIKKTPPPDDVRHLSPEDVAALFIYLQDASVAQQPKIDDPLDLANKRVWLISDHIREQVDLLLPEIRKRILFFLENNRDSARVPLNFAAKTSKALDPLFKEELCRINDDANPLSELSLKRMVTLLGPKGIRNTHGAMDRRGVHASHYGRICLSETPESEKIGFNLHLALAAKVEDGNIKAPYTKKDDPDHTRWFSVKEEASETMGPKACEEYRDKEGTALARKEGGCIERVNLSNITLYDRYRAQFLGLGANLIPFIQHDDNNRVMMGAKNMKQALPLLYPEEPLIKTGREDLAARLSGHALYAGSGGRVESVRETEIVVTSEDEEENIYRLKPLRPTTANTITWHRPLVKRGDEVEKGQVLADGACTSNGMLALGVNLLVAYMPYYGLNFEDGIVISDRLVKEDVLTSLHLNALHFDVYGDERMGSEENRLDMIPFFVNKGIFCWEGREVIKGDRIFGKYRKEGKEKRKEWFNSPVNGTVIDFLKQDIEPDATSPSRIRYRMICHVLEERKINVGDKLMGWHGNKGVVSRILPTEEMPHLEDGTSVDIILNPHGVISRMNLGQILETHLGWIVKHGGERYKKYGTVAPFERVSEEELKGAFKYLGGTRINEYGKARLIDGRSGREIENRVTIGYQYFMKLNHLAVDKINVRETAGYTLLTRQPPRGKKATGGQRAGEMEVWALEAHMARNILQELMTVKADAVHIRKGDITQQYFDKASPLDKGIPFQETLRATATLLRGLCLDMTFHDTRDNAIPLDSNKMLKLDHIQIRLADPDTIKNWAENREVTNPERPTIKRGQIEPIKQGLINPSLFKDARTDMAFIQLAEPVIHPLFLKNFKGLIKEAANNKKKSGDLLAALDFRTAVMYGPQSENEKIYYRYDFASVPISYSVRACGCGKLTAENGANGVCAECGKTVRKRNLYTEFEAGGRLVEHLLGDELKLPLKNALLTAIPVLPSDYRPLWATHGEIHVKSELNDFYRQILEANESLKKALESGNSLPGRKLFDQRARLQQAVNRLMAGDKETAKKHQKSIGERIKGKEGILRMYHLGKRVDVSARSVIVPQPELEPDQAGIPLEMAAGLMRSKLTGVLAAKCEGKTPKEKAANAQTIIDRMDEPIYREMIQEILFGRDSGLFRDAMILLTRAPSLHKYNILAFHPVCADHKAIGLHPLSCNFFNADFDGDQMGVFVPLSKEALAEAKDLLNPLKNLLSAANGRPMFHLSQDIVLGIYLLTSDDAGRNIFNEWFQEAKMTPVTTPVNGKKLVDLLYEYHSKLGDSSKTAQLAQEIMAQGFQYATLSGMTFSIFDVPYLNRSEIEKIITNLPEADWKNTISESLEEQCGIIGKEDKGEPGENERTIESPVALMVRSGARGNMKQVVQLGGIRGELKDIRNRPLIPQVMGNFREGISPLEYYLGSHSARRSMCEKKLMTAPAGDFTRVMVEAGYRMIIKGDDCGTTEGLHIYPFPPIDDPAFEDMPALHKRLAGRMKVNGDLIDESEALALGKKGKPVYVRSALTCDAEKKWGPGAICRKCYGWDLSKRDLPKMGLPVGILAGESIGERGTQLTMRTFHTGGAGGGGITEGLPRIKKILGNNKIRLTFYRIDDPGSTNLKKGDCVDQWSLLIEASKIDAKGIQPKVTMMEDAPPEVKDMNLQGIMDEYGLDEIRMVLAYEARRLYKGDVDEKHFEVLARSMLFRSDKGDLHFRGIRGVPFNQSGFLAAASFQRSLDVLAAAALEGRVERFEGYKERLITGKKIMGDTSNG